MKGRRAEIKEVYDKQVTGVGDRFEYDGFHRLQDGWLGVDQTTMDMTTIDEEEAEFVQRLTYNLDDANNRSSVVTQDGPEGTPDTDTYTTQDSWHTEQGPSNRYHAVGSELLLYDYRGNLIYDERRALAYLYDFRNRLSKVYSVSFGESMSSNTSTSLASSRTFYLSDPTPLHRAQAEIKQKSGGLEEILKTGECICLWRKCATELP